jgi:ubiquinone/menaquinone biosynthesis C-methylase UbiE
VRKIDKKEIIKHYSKLISKYGFNISGMGWGNNELDKRYKIFVKHLDLKNRNILDYGCGISNLYNFLNKKKIKYKKYIAHDINPDLIDYYKVKKFRKFKFINKKKFILKEKIDFSISNGVHNFNTKNNLKNFNNDIKFLYKISRIGFGISFLNDNVDYKEKYLSYKKMADVIKILKKLNYIYIIDQTFKKYETFLFVFKNKY